MAEIVLETPRLRLRPFTAEELAQLLPRWEKAPAAARHPGGMCAADYRAAAESALGAAE